MTGGLDEKLLLSMLKPIFSFLQTKCRSSLDAEDVMQEIALKLLRTLRVKKGLQNPKAYIWAVVHNTLTNYYRASHSLGCGVFFENITDEKDVADDVVFKETKKKLQREIAYLSKVQRQVIILFYFENMRQEEIAKELGISLSMVKWHLFESKKQIKRSMETMTYGELKFNPISFTTIGCNGSVGEKGHNQNFLRSKLAQNIIYAAYKKPLEINEIADVLGVSPVYIESEIEFLTENGFILETGKRYVANCLIEEPTKELVDLHNAMYLKAAKLVAGELLDCLNSSINLGSGGIFCPGRDKNFVLWALVPYVLSKGGSDLISRDITFEEAATVRPDGGHNICSCSVLRPGVSPPLYWESLKKMSGPSWNGDEEFLLWLIDTEWSFGRIDDYGANIQRDYRLLRRFVANDDILSKEESAHLISRGYLKNEVTETGPIQNLQIVWVKGKAAKERLLEIGDKVKRRHYSELEELKEPFVAAIMERTPDHLKKAQGYGLQHIFHSDAWFIIHSLKYLVSAGKLKPVTKDEQRSLTAVVTTAI